MAVDEDGCEMNGDHMMVHLPRTWHPEGPKGNTVVGTVMSNYGLETFSEREASDWFDSS